MPRTIFPSEVADWFAMASMSRAQIAGRVIDPRPAPDGSPGCWRFGIADAWTTVGVRADSPPRVLAEGDLVEVEIERTDSGHESVVRNWVRHSSGLLRGGDGEWQRLALRGRAQALAARDHALRAVRDFFHREKFLEVMTPSFAPCPGLDAHVHSLAEVRRGQRQDYLVTSPELHMKRLLVGGMPRIFQLARVYRAEELGAWHEPEFCMLEWYRAFAGYRTVLADTEHLVREVARRVSGAEELHRVTDTGVHKISLEREFLRITVSEAFAEFAAVQDVSNLIEEDETRYFELLVTHVEPGLARLASPVFLTDYPARYAALAQKCPHDARFAERFELYAGGVELCNGFGELCDPVEQRLRFEEEQERRQQGGEPVYPLDERFLAALTEGLPPSAGNALGLDRLIALAMGSPDIATTFAFPDVDR